MHSSTLILTILVAGLASQWVAWRTGLPAIIILIVSGLVLGPITGWIELGLEPEQLTELIGLGVAIILFEGGMDLKLGELKKTGHGIGRLTVLAAPMIWVFGSVAAHYLAGLSWPVAWVLGAILVVTGPTVVLPLLRQARLNKQSASLLKWEGIVNDPVGVLLAVLTFQYFTLPGEGIADTLTGLGKAIGAAAVLGGLGGLLIGWLYRRGHVPEHLKPPLLMVLVLLVFWLSNLVQHEAGLLSVTVMGLVIGNLPLGGREDLMRFKQHLTVVLLSVLFIVIPTQLEVEQLDLLDWRIGLFVLCVLLVVRPLAVGLATIGASMRGSDRVLLAWIAPRGIVAAVTAGLFGPAMIAAGYPDADKLLPIVFLIILVTVLAHGLTIGAMARWLDLAAEDEHGLLIVGASPWTRALAQVLGDRGLDVLIVDNDYDRLKSARMDGIEVYHGEILSDRAEEEMETQHLDNLLCATENDFYNALVCRALGHRVGRHRSFQTATHMQSDREENQIALQQRGHIAFDKHADIASLNGHMEAGWSIHSTSLSDRHDFDALKDRLGAPGEDWLLLGAVKPDGQLRLYSDEQSFEPDSDWVVLFFAPGSD